jgi:sigma-B regulation protein RsbU (phosphoserine phosphatase)
MMTGPGVPHCHLLKLKHAAALGFFPGAQFGTTTTQLSPGDLVLLFTDGIIEAENTAGSQWGLAGLKQTVRANLPAPGSTLLSFLLAQAQAFTGANEFVDDICLAAVELLGDSPARA